MPMIRASGTRSPRFHVALGLLAQFGAGLNRAAQDIAGGDLHRAVDGGQSFGHCAFTGAWGAQQDNFHGVVLLKLLNMLI